MERVFYSLNYFVVSSPVAYSYSVAYSVAYFVAYSVSLSRLEFLLPAVTPSNHRTFTKNLSACLSDCLILRPSFKIFSIFQLRSTFHLLKRITLLRQFITQHIRSMVGNHQPPTAFLYPPGDPGLFGPDSMAWRVHADFVSMMIGGISSLILQALHPLALAGVWDHSNFRQDLKGRLGRTAYFIAVTTYGNTEMAHQIISKVKRIHDALHGTHPDGRSYSVSDPVLLYWVHLTEATSFLNAYQTYFSPTLNTAQQDLYLSEMAVIVRLLGCEMNHSDGRSAIAQTLPEANQAILNYLPELEYSQRSKEIIQLLEDFPGSEEANPFVKLLIKAGFNNLPNWAYPLMGRKPPSPLEKLVLNQTIQIAAKPVRWALQDGIASHARKRMGLFD